MARAAVEKASEESEAGTAIYLESVVWAQPIVVNGLAQKVHIELFGEDSGLIRYEVYTTSDNQEGAIVHSQGVAEFKVKEEISPLDIQNLQSQMDQGTLNAKKCYQTFKEIGIDYGDSYRGIREIYQGENQVFARLRLPSSIQDTQSEYVLHPSLMDSALQASIGLIFKNGKLPGSRETLLRPSLPFALESLEIFAPCTSEMYAWVRYSDSSVPFDKIHKLDIDIYDEQGNVCMKLRGVSYAIEKTTFKKKTVTRWEFAKSEEAATNSQISSLSSEEKIQKFLQQTIADELQKSAHQIQVDQSYFEMGIGSLGIVQVVKRLESLLDEELSPTLLFEYVNIQQLSVYVSQQFASRVNSLIMVPHKVEIKQIKEESSEDRSLGQSYKLLIPYQRKKRWAGPVKTNEIEEETVNIKNKVSMDFPLSEGEKGIWVLQIANPSMSAYNIPICYQISGDINLEYLGKAWDFVLKQYPILKARIYEKDGIPHHYITNECKTTIQKEHITIQNNKELLRFLKDQVKQSFNLEKGLLTRMQVFTRENRDWILLITIHHIVSDGTSVVLLMEILLKTYKLIVEGTAPSQNRDISSYQEFVCWEKMILESPEGRRNADYWKQQLIGELPILEVLPDFPRPSTQSLHGKTLTKKLPAKLAQWMVLFSKSQKLKPSILFLAIFQILLHKYTHEEDIIIGMPVTVRPLKKFESVMGYCINMVGIRGLITPETRLLEFFKQLQLTQVDALYHSGYPFLRVVQDLKIQRTSNVSPLFQIAYAYQNFVEESVIDDLVSFSNKEFSLEAIEGIYQEDNFDLGLDVFEEKDSFQLHLKYNPDLYREETVERMLEHYCNLIETVSGNHQLRIKEYNLLLEKERQQILYKFNGTQSDYPKDQTIVGLFQAQVEKTPDNLALIFENQQLSYRELNLKANQLAHYLLSFNTDTDNSLVGICVERSLEMVIGLLGILKAGSAYVPLDPDYPLSRLQFMLEDSEVPLLISQSHLLKKLPVLEMKVVCLDSEWDQIAGYSVENPIRYCGPGNLAYVIYTSGSTGVPKGCQVTHSNVTRLFAATETLYNFNQQDVWTLFHSYAFDFSVWEIWGALFYGGKLVVVPYFTSRTHSKFYQLLIDQGVTVLNQTPSAFRQLINVDDKPDELSLRLVIFGGETLDFKMLKPWFASHEDKRPELVNMYGITETTVHVTYYPITKEQNDFKNIIGRPLPDLQVWVLDAHHQQVSIGVPGQMYVGGAGVTCGYHQRPELTVEKFIEIEIFGKRQRVYKTGDLARWLPDGNLEYLGRIDNQVKLRGFRIELSEISVTLSQHEAVNEAVVALHNKEDNPSLAAYVTLSMPIDEVPGILRSWLKTRLPEYMLPASFTVLDKLPLTPNGKIDRKALPTPDLSIQAEQQFPRTETEHLLCNLWSQVLGIEVTSISSNFFESGGHSLLATRLVSCIRSSFGIEMPLRVVFEQALLKDQAEWLDKQQRGSELPPIVPLSDSESAVLSFAQQRLWFLAQLEGQNTTYNMPAALHLKGKINETALQNSLTVLIQRHDSLRSCFPIVDGEATIQLVDSYNPLSITDLSDLAEADQQQQVTKLIADHAKTLFDLSTGPLLSLHLLKLNKYEQTLLFNMHHIISDGWSMGVLIREWSQIYNAYAQNQEPQLPELPIQYTDYAAWQRNWLQGEILEQQLGYWRKKLTGVPELLELHTDYPRPAVMRYKGKHIQSTLSQELTQGIKQLSCQHGVTLFMTLLSAFKVLLYRYSGQTDLVVGSPIANRTHNQSEDLIGYFVNTLVLRTQIKGDQTFPELLKLVRQTALEAYGHQDIPFEYLVEQMNPSRSLSHSQLFQVMFALQNTPEEELELSYLEVTFLKTENPTAKFDLTLSIVEQGGVCVCDWKYRTDLFHPETITRMTKHFQVLLEGIINNPEQTIYQLPLITCAEQEQLLAWNQTETDYSKDQTIIDLFQCQVDKNPENIAVVFEGDALSYGALNKSANQLAHYLMTLGVGAETIVGICMERSLEMVIGLLGILKAGGAYVPLDPDYPLIRLQFMLEDSKVKVLLSQSHLLERLPISIENVVCLDRELKSIATYSEENPMRQGGTENLAYVIYTSGSTGMPKGCQVTHSNVTRLFAATEAWYNFNNHDVWTMFHSYAFDFSVWEIWGALLYGCKLIVVPYYTSRSSSVFYQLLIEQGVTILNQTPSAFKQLINVDNQPDELSLRIVIFGGEALDTSTLQQWFARHADNNPKLVNMYGITETTVHNTYFPIIKDQNHSNSLIGRPIPDVQVWVVDAVHQPVPIGVPGEMLVGGAGVARGYLNRIKLTAENFIEIEIFGKRQRVYKTGDLARWLPDGNLEYLGRLDQQVKVRGFRIELGEIETALNQHDAVEETVVVFLDQESNDRLVAYVVLTMPVDDVAGVLRTWLKARLPEYMLPASFTVLEQLPLTPNGKIDHKALPLPGVVRTTKFIAPQTGIEKLIANIWQEILGIDRIGIHDDFFAMGGHSLSGMRFINKLNDKTREIFYIYALFEASTIAKFGDYLKIHYPQLAEKMDDSYSCPKSREKVSLEKLVQFRKLLPELSFNNSSSSDKNSPAVFILAPPRSGTTLLRSILGGHPGLFAPPEMELLGFNNLKERYSRCMERDSFWLQGTIRALMEIENCDVEEAKMQMRSYEENDLDIKQFYNVLQTAVGDKLLVDKTPFYALDINILRQGEEYFDNAVYIHLLRHPYGMIHSFESARLEQIISSHPYAFPLAGSGSSSQLAEFLWLQCHQNIIKFLETIPASRHYTLKFEDLVKHPQPNIEKLCEFLDIPFDSNMLLPYQDKKQRMTDGLHAVGKMLGDIKFHSHQQIDATVAEEWKTSYKENFLGDFTWSLAEQLGYQRELRWMNIPRIADEKSLTLSFAQQRLWFLAQLENQSITYNIPAAIHIEGELNETVLQNCLTALIQRHESLRLCFPVVDGEATVQINKVYNPFKVTDLSDLAEKEQQQKVTKLISDHSQTLFNLNSGPLLSLQLLKLSKQEQILLFNMHHIISDGWSVGVLIRELSHLYNAYARNHEPQLPKLSIQYTDYAAWQRNWLQGEILEQQLTYWIEKLTGVTELLELPTDYPRPAVMRYQGKHLQSTLSLKLTHGIKQLSRQHGVTDFMALLAAFKVLLSRYSSQTDIAVGSPIANRTQHQTENLIGFFVNTLVLRTELNEKQTFTELLKKVRQTALEAYSNQDIPFEYLVEQINPSRSLSHSPLFQVMFVLQNTPQETLDFTGLKMSMMKPENTTTKFDLTLSVSEQSDQFVCYWEYNTDLFRPDTVTRMAEHFQVLLEWIVKNPEQTLMQFSLLTETDQQQLLAWNQTETNYREDQTIVDLFEAQVEKTPDNVAVVFENHELSYRELNRKSNQLAHYLLSLKCCKNNGILHTDNCLVGICIERSMEMVIGLLAILKAGRAYVPLDPDYPLSRLQFMLEDSSVPVLLSQSPLMERFPVSRAHVVCLDTEWEQIACYSGENPERQSGPEELAYVIYTSGSTGIPKGAMNLHKGICNRLLWMQDAYKLTVADTVLQKTPFSFDVSVWEFWWPLFVGARLTIAKPGGHKESDYLIKLIEQEQITTIHFVPSMLQVFLQEPAVQDCHSLKRVICSGEALPVELEVRFLTRLPAVELHNLYGPTEAAVDVTYWACQRDNPLNCVPIGVPIANTQIYILDVHHNSAPPGIPGELCIAGKGLARGYLNRPELTAGKFIEIEMFGKRQRIYRTGDLARWLPDGNLEFLRRLDNQVKLRGFRIELSEIEVTLSQNEAVKEAVVALYNKEDNSSLAAYVTLTMSIDDVSGVLRTWLKARLPEYMLPASFTVLEKIPLTPNGKIDRKALPIPDLTTFFETYEAPRTDTEQRLVEVWNHVLKQANIGIHDNFFEHGGDSILSIQIVAQVRTVGLELSPRDLFQYQTIAELAQVVKPVSTLEIDQGPVVGKVPLTPIQQAFLSRQPVEPWYFNQAIMLAVPANMNEVALQKALTMVFKHHDALRMRYHQHGDGWQQSNETVSPDGQDEELPFHIEDLSYLSKEQQLQALRERSDFWQASFNLENGPLVRLVMFNLGAEFRLLWSIHHLVVDGVSWRILIEDLQTVYNQVASNQAIRLPAKTSSFKVWAERLVKWQDEEFLVAEADYWRKLPTGTSLPVDNLNGSNRFVDVQHYTIHFTSEMTQRLLIEAPAAYRTKINDLLLTALMLSLHNWTGERHHLIDLEGHGRADLFEEIDLSRTVGWFTALYTLSLQLPIETDIGTSLKYVKEQLRRVPHEGVSYGVLRYLCQESLPQGQILFNYLGQFDQSVDDSMFSLAEEETGRSHSLLGERKYLIEINGQMINGCLSLTWSFSSKQYQTQTIKKLVYNYKFQLEQLIEHCSVSFGYTSSDFPLSLLTQAQLDQLTQSYKDNIADIYPLSPMQQGMLFHKLYAPESGIYFEQIHFCLNGQLNIEAFCDAWQYLIDRHTILRTAFLHETDNPLQLVYKKVNFSCQTFDWREFSETQRNEQLQKLLKAERSQGFEINHAPLMRVQVILETDCRSRLVWHHHHLLMDGWCLPILFTELFAAYSSFDMGQNPSLPSVRPYKAYINWLVEQDQEKAKVYWQEQLEGFLSPTPLPIMQCNDGQSQYQELTLTLEPQLSQELKKFSRQYRLTLNTLVQGAWAALLSRYSGENDVVFGVTISGRQVPVTCIDRMLGLFINTLPLRVKIENSDILSVLQIIQQQQQQNNQYAYAALADIQDWSAVPNGLSLFDTIVVFENYPVDEKLRDKQSAGSLQITDLQAIEYTNYPITLVVIPGQEIHFKLTYDSNRFQNESIDKMLAHLSILLNGMVAKPDYTWHQLHLLTGTEQEQLMLWNQRLTNYPDDLTIVDLYQAQVEKTPDNIAVVLENQQMSYRELNMKANQLAHYLISLGVEAETLVCLCVERSLEMVIGLLGILKAGGAYVPLDPDYPLSRLQLMLEDSFAPVLLSQNHLMERLPVSTAKVVCLDSDWQQIEVYSGENPPRQSGRDNLVYVIYTSGSTGTPKGVMNQHKGICNRLLWMQDAYQLTAADNVLQKTPFSFDVSVWEFFWPLLVGARLTLAKPGGHKESDYLIKLIEQEQITTLHFVPSMLHVFLQVPSLKDCHSVKRVICSGEALPVELVSRFFMSLPTAELHNLYGPTEAAVDVTYWECLLSNTLNLVPIGRPIANTQIYILDANHNPTPPGIPGELCIAGRGLARGYLNRPELTAEKFIEMEIFDKHKRIYKTGDLARWLPDGNLEFFRTVGSSN